MGRGKPYLAAFAWWSSGAVVRGGGAATGGGAWRRCYPGVGKVLVMLWTLGEKAEGSGLDRDSDGRSLQIRLKVRGCGPFIGESHGDTHGIRTKVGKATVGEECNADEFPLVLEMGVLGLDSRVWFEIAQCRSLVTKCKELQVACFPFDDHNCPPIQLIISFCQSAYSWLKEDIENVVVVHCKAGMARTGLMICSLLLFLKFFPTAEECIDYYNQKRCLDGKGLVLPSQIRYVKYFERILTYFNGETQPGRRCMLRGFRLHRCPYWVRPSITVSDHNGLFSLETPNCRYISVIFSRKYTLTLLSTKGLTIMDTDSVTDYADEFYKFMVRNDLHETEEQLVSRYVGESRMAIRNGMDMQRLWTLNDAFQLALKVEVKLACKGARKFVDVYSLYPSSKRVAITARSHWDIFYGVPMYDMYGDEDEGTELLPFDGHDDSSTISSKGSNCVSNDINVTNKLENYWFSAPKKGVVVFALPGEPGLTELAGDFKIHFHDSQGDFYWIPLYARNCWLNSTMMENRKFLNASDLDGFDKIMGYGLAVQRKLPSPGFQVEVVLIDCDGTVPTRSKTEATNKGSDASSGTSPASGDGVTATPDPSKGSGSQDKDDLFSDGEAEEPGSSKSRQGRVASEVGRPATTTFSGPETGTTADQVTTVTRDAEQVSLRSEGSSQIQSTGEPRSDGGRGTTSGPEVPNLDSAGVSDFKAIAADASVFTFGDEDDYESE
ncbi:hypothetical protein HHK36_002635 [Tetracentron sinense]|uniref:Phosphatidylinositol-3,4,5-trisphosphate 3-phosphatase n=1 Tax=Tetracentron sinense TaxID=13715 RepID=A0A835DMY0_TETSI|nr:hypothetical protein HHK36_002635 [Tetracentron sinense]